MVQIKSMKNDDTFFCKDFYVFLTVFTGTSADCPKPPPKENGTACLDR